MITQPTVGRTVHYWLDDKPLAAIIVDVPELLSEQMNYGPEGYVKAVNLVIFNSAGFAFKRDVYYSVDRKNEYWSWPEKS